jgi:patatin-like phospholipase/acyl hydrolase
MAVDDDGAEEANTGLPPYTTFRVKKNKKAVLSLDGGGVRGLITTYILQALQDELRTQTKIPDLLIGEAFDVIAGTSTGSILATYLTAYCGLAENKTVKGRTDSVVLDGTAERATQMYELFTKEIFPEKATGKRGILLKVLFGDRPIHNDKGLNNVLDQAFGHLTLDWLANRKTNKLLKVDEKDGTKKEASVASLFVTAYDLTYDRPVAFMADRHFQTARFIGVDPLTRPYKEGGFQVLSAGHKAEAWDKDLEKAHKEIERRDGKVAYKINNLGDAQLPLLQSLTQDFDRYRKSLDKHVDVSLSKICRCSSAAPVYLAPGRIENFFGDLDLVCCDGGVVANAPALTAFNAMYFQACAEYGGPSDDILKERPSLEELEKFDISNFTNHMVLSIGCGQTQKEVDPKKAPSGGLLSYLMGSGNLIDVLMSSSSQLSHVNMEAIFASRDAWENYLRIQLSINEAFRESRAVGGINDKAIVQAMKSMDNASPEVLKIYKEAGMYLAEVYRPLIKRFVTRMLQL